jgi:two-component system response regulator YesN
MRSIRVLVADDEATVRTFIKMVVSREKLPVADLAEADNGLDAVRLAREWQPDLVFLDIRMPGLDGLQAAEAILAADAGVSVVIVSAFSEFDYARTAFRAGVVDYLLKPVRPADVAEAVKKAAGKAGRDSQPVKVPAMVRAVADYVAANLSRPIRLQDVANAVFVSPYHLSRTFKQLTGQSLVDYIQDQRLAKAEEILLTTELTITEVAGLAGFSDAAYFATCFKNRTGCSPMQFRKTRTDRQ